MWFKLCSVMTKLYYDLQSYSFLRLPGNLMGTENVVHSDFVLSL